MGLAIMRGPEEGCRVDSALLDLQSQLAARAPISAADIHAAVTADVSAARPISLVVLTKLLDSKAIPLDHAAIVSLGAFIRDEMVKLPLTEPELFINYAQAAVICVKSAGART